MKTKVNVPTNTVTTSKQRKALVLSAGGSHCAYQVGVLSQLTKKWDYDLICGVSGGALNASFLAMFPIGNAELAVKELKKVLYELDQDDIHKNWCCLGLLMGLFKSSFKNSEPLTDLVNKMLDQNKIKNSGIKLRIGATDIQNGKYKVFTENDENIKKAVIASSSFPGFFKPIEIDNSIYVDGGLKDYTPLKAAVDAGATDIDVIMTQPNKMPYQTVRGANAIDIALRSIQVMTNEILLNDINLVLEQNKTRETPINIRVIKPKLSLGHNSLEFNNEDIRRFILIGEQDGAKYL